MDENKYFNFPLKSFMAFLILMCYSRNQAAYNTGNGGNNVHLSSAILSLFIISAVVLLFQHDCHANFVLFDKIKRYVLSSCFLNIIVCSHNQSSSSNSFAAG